MTSEFLFGMHDYHDDWANMVRQAGKQAWCVHTEAVGTDSNDHSGKTYPESVTNVVRLNNGYGKGTGVIPLPAKYDDFAKRCANFVGASKNIQYIVVGNEIQLTWEWPSDDPIRLTDYVACYLKCYDAIKSVAPQVQISMQSPAPWNPSTPDAQDWITQLATQLNMVGSKVDWIALHAYTKGYGADKFSGNPTMNPPWNHRKFGWEALYEYMQIIPFAHRQLPVIITEANADSSWQDDPGDWIQQMYAEVDKWNKGFGNQKILGACPFRWAKHDDRWDMSRHSRAVDDFRAALQRDYRHGWQSVQSTVNQRCVNAPDGLNLRDMPNGNIVTTLANGTPVEVISEHDEWLLVTVSGQRGFVFGKYIT